jgi:hypothetical protein
MQMTINNIHLLHTRLLRIPYSFDAGEGIFYDAIANVDTIPYPTDPSFRRKPEPL